MSSGDLFKPDLRKNQTIQTQRSPETGLHRHGYKMIRIYECSYLTLGWRVNNWSITSHQRRTCGLTLLLPPPGTCLMLSIDPIFDWALNSSFSDMISTFPPPWKGRSNSSWFHSIKCRIISIKSKVWVVVWYVNPRCVIYLVCGECCLSIRTLTAHCPDQSFCGGFGPFQNKTQGFLLFFQVDWFTQERLTL